MNTPWPTLVAVDSAPVQPWRNGGGRTRELWRWPAETAGGTAAADERWQLRISVADIEQDGAFSAFPGVHRAFAVLSGAGVWLSWPGQPAQRLTPGSPALHFDGAAAPDCRLIAGPTRDLNLMSRGQPARLLAAQPGRPGPAGAGWRGLFSTQALRLDTGQGALLDVPAWHLVCALAEASSPGWTLHPTTHSTPPTPLLPTGLYWWQCSPPPAHDPS